jgi:acylphosphatase
MLGEGERIKIRTHVYLSGKVQGVFFRARTVELAVRLGATGWVRNLPDGRVEAVFEGEGEVVKTLVDFCRRGPRRALVENIVIINEPFKGEFVVFSIRR